MNCKAFTQYTAIKTLLLIQFKLEEGFNKGRQLLIVADVPSGVLVLDALDFQNPMVDVFNLNENRFLFFLIVQ